MPLRSPRRTVATMTSLVALTGAVIAATAGSAAGAPAPIAPDAVPDTSEQAAPAPDSARPGATAEGDPAVATFAPPASTGGTGVTTAAAPVEDFTAPSPIVAGPVPPAGLTGVSASVPLVSDGWLDIVIAMLAAAAAEPVPTYDPWAAVRQCESHGNYATNTGNGFYGAYQFTIGTWNWVASQVLPAYVGVRPDQAPAWAQDRMAEALAFEVAGGGLHHWPVCGRLYGS